MGMVRPRSGLRSVGQNAHLGGIALAKRLDARIVAPAERRPFRNHLEQLAALLEPQPGRHRPCGGLDDRDRIIGAAHQCC